MTIHLLAIEHRHGTDYWACATHDIAELNLYNYVGEWWEHKLPGERMPLGIQEAIDAYFNKMQEWGEESYSIDELEVLESAPVGIHG